MKTISIKWSTIDVLGLAEAMDLEITESQAEEILDRLVEHHDADIGINWGVIEYHIEDLLAEDGKKNN
jgi:hypothetical protein